MIYCLLNANTIFTNYACLASAVALEYANLAIKSPKAHETWEVLISAYTLHCMQGRALFEAWRTYTIKEEPE